MTNAIFVVFYIYFQSFLLNLLGPSKQCWSTSSVPVSLSTSCVIFCACFCRARCFLPPLCNSHLSLSSAIPAILSVPLVTRGNIHGYVSLYSLPCIFVPCSFICHLRHSLSSKESWSFQSCFTWEFHMLLISLKELTDKQRSYRMAKLMCYFKLLPCCKTADSWASELTVHRWCHRQIEMITSSVSRYYSISVCQAEPWFISLNVFYISCVVWRWRGLNWT